MLSTLISSIPVDFRWLAFVLSPPINVLMEGDTGGGGDGRGGGGGGTGGDGGGTMREWSSTIGIVTAIIGNILISFALNIQRYAHIRIEREYERRRQRLGYNRTASGRSNVSGRISSSNYGTALGQDGERDVTYSGSEDRNGIARTDHATANGPRHGGERHASSRSSDEHGRYRDSPIHGDNREQDADHLQQSFLSDTTLAGPEKPDSVGDRKSYLRSPYWWAGIILMTIGEAGNFLAYGFAPASIVSPLGVVALISNCIIAPFMLKEVFRQRDFWGVLVAVAGAVTIVLSAKTSETKIGPGDIWGMITQWEFELYLGLTIALIMCLMWVSDKYGRNSILIDVGLVGLFGGYTALSTKGVASLLSFTLWHVITFPITYALVAVLISSALMQIRYINRALQRFDSTQVIPTQFVLFTISVIVGSAVLYRDFESTTLQQASKFIGGCALTFMGVYLITSCRERPEDMTSESDEEEAIGLLDGERYRDEVHQEDEVYTQSQPRRSTGLDGTIALPSPARSIFGDEDVEEDDDEMRTPKAPLSSSTSSPAPSLSGVSSLTGSHDANPWAEHDVDLPSSLGSEPGLPVRTETEPTPQPPPEETYNTPPTKVLLRFPSAPGLAESTAHLPIETPQTPRPSTPQPPPPPPNNGQSQRRSTLPRTPGSISARHSLTQRFAPGPFLPPLSGGLSAVVAESLRRGEGSPRQQQRRDQRKDKDKRRAINNKPPTGTLEGGGGDVVVGDNTARGGGGAEAGGETEYETDASALCGEDRGNQSRPGIAGFGRQQQQQQQLHPHHPGASRSNTHQGTLPTLSTGNAARQQQQWQGDTGIEPADGDGDGNGNGGSNSPRLRSFSDPWRGGQIMGWLGGSFRSRQGSWRGNRGRRESEVLASPLPAEDEEGQEGQEGGGGGGDDEGVNDGGEVGERR
ncbi:hypothetical protein AJ80_03639 [Polytolypa hystricis UAMH7299]|uniref:Uncharacterized protein n=1 Tax=Polytolypa hystricis (strain UAMH7299) TaxID=1447883 RepID=A0A2B7YH70_POLH7|nr:hypothetical protein AJ80_03639 [Polytolypa hystricis UAMH7299]